jgi:hypothetical protein
MKEYRHVIFVALLGYVLLCVQQPSRSVVLLMRQTLGLAPCWWLWMMAVLVVVVVGRS